MNNRIEILDISKYFLSLIIIAIHCSLFPNGIVPMYNVAVPLFFVITSYLFHNKLNSEANNKNVLSHYIKRNVIYYLFWLVVLLPLTIWRRRVWFNEGVIKGLITVAQNTLFASTFTTSWFITAAIISSIILYKTRHINKKIMIPSLLFLYACLCVYSSYYSLLPSSCIFVSFFNTYEKLFLDPLASFPNAIVWMYVGKFFSDYEYNSGKHNINTKNSIICVLVTSVLFYIEWKIAYYLKGEDSTCLLFTLLPFCASVFSLLISFKNIKTNINIKYISIESIISFPLHSAIIKIIEYFETHFNVYANNISRFFITVFICHMFTMLVLKLENKKRFSILKYSH